MSESAWILTRTGKHFDLLDPQPDMVDIRDIAHALGNLCRFAGHCARFHSVAEHSVGVADLLPPELKLEGLLHDAAEAYVGDCTQPLKAVLHHYQRIESRIDTVIREHFGLPHGMSPEVKVADLRMLAEEREKLMPEDDTPWAILQGVEPARGAYVGWCAPNMASALFLGAYESIQSWHESRARAA
ncbi:hypothetical protein [Niveibacterium sp. SC-1]|uniref:hypothetical protein n=1 Tax=Niveibacterium sp. SC-1 TaxID=3135646 RepID=UPI00311FE168